jgi:hypothetical protein
MVLSRAASITSRATAPVTGGVANTQGRRGAGREVRTSKV